MASKPFSIDTRNFTSQTEARAFFKSMLNRYVPGDRVTDVDAADLAALLKRHTEYQEKIGSGIDYFAVRAADYNTQCFEVVRTDGSCIDFSYIHCIDRTPR